MGVHRSRPALVGALVAAVVCVATIRPSLAQTGEPPPPTPVPIPGGGSSPSPFPSTLHTPAPRSLDPPEIGAASAVLTDLDTGQVLFALDATERRPIASLTKIMTAFLVMTRTAPADVVTVSDDAASGRVVGISGLGLEAGERIKVGQLLYALLLQSANDAAVALAEDVSGTSDAFVAAMNRTADRLGMAHTHFTSPNGLDDAGYSTARDLARITRAAYEVPGFADIVATRFHSIPAPQGEPRIVQNRNALLWLYPGALGVKTGFTSAAGYCVVATAQRGDERLLAVVLGEPGEPFSDAAALLNYGFADFDRRSLVTAGEDLAMVSIDGRAVQVASGATLDGLVPVDARVHRDLAVDPSVRFPPGRGQDVGSLTLSVPGLVLGAVPIVVTDVEPPPPLEHGGSWWSRAAGAVVHAGGGVLDALFG
jgi:serine-type D-Ala-D-Ala carboxypeptidase (penicillin-binding protein 5/6)